MSSIIAITNGSSLFLVYNYLLGDATKHHHFICMQERGATHVLPAFFLGKLFRSVPCFEKPRIVTEDYRSEVEQKEGKVK